MVWLNNSLDSTGTPCDARTGIVRAPHGNLQCFFISYGACTGPVRDPQGCRMAPLRTRKGIDTTIIGKNPARASYLTVRGPYGPHTGPRGLFTGCLWFLNPHGARKLMIHALKVYGPRTGWQNSYGAAIYHAVPIPDTHRNVCLPATNLVILTATHIQAPNGVMHSVEYRQSSNIRSTESQPLNVSCLVLQLPIPLK